MKNIFLQVVIFMAMAAYSVPQKALAYGATFDGGMLEGMVDECSCTGGETIRVNSYVDNSSHVYWYEWGATQLYANYNISSSGGYFLTTLMPFAICMVYEGEDCNNSSESPEGMFLMTGTSYNLDKQSLMALLGELPGAKAFSKEMSRLSPKLDWKI